MAVPGTLVPKCLTLTAEPWPRNARSRRVAIWLGQAVPGRDRRIPLGAREPGRAMRRTDRRPSNLRRAVGFL